MFDGDPQVIATATCSNDPRYGGGGGGGSLGWGVWGVSDGGDRLTDAGSMLGPRGSAHRRPYTD